MIQCIGPTKWTSQNRHPPVKAIGYYSPSYTYTVIELAVLLPVVVIAGLTIIPDALAQIGAAVFLPVASLDKGPSASLAESNVGLASIIIQRTGIDRCKAAQTVIRSIDD